eukprot:TRINITY_DN2628_c0_g1_i2.p1 TRINITY_DN2628_c0_g1~~TRINITY_DN2628_c0_g1_i2.p1  ORF type:complete len:291 (-),score=46.10 TRINITY_DN2628_c0_g1_i2:94-966(-)
MNVRKTPDSLELSKKSVLVFSILPIAFVLFIILNTIAIQSRLTCVRYAWDASDGDCSIERSTYLPLFPSSHIKFTLKNMNESYVVSTSGERIDKSNKQNLGMVAVIIAGQEFLLGSGYRVPFFSSSREYWEKKEKVNDISDFILGDKRSQMVITDDETQPFLIVSLLIVLFACFTTLVFPYSRTVLLNKDKDILLIQLTNLFGVPLKSRHAKLSSIKKFDLNPNNDVIAVPVSSSDNSLVLLSSSDPTQSSSMKKQLNAFHLNEHYRPKQTSALADSSKPLSPYGAKQRN